MLVYGDLERGEDASAIVGDIVGQIASCQALAGLHRHQTLVALFIRAGELVQGALDKRFHLSGEDELGPLQDAGAGLLLSLAGAVARSWNSGFASEPLPTGLLPHLDVLGAAGTIQTRRAEGYSFYALYPESYVQAARARRLGPDTLVIGIRSIGAGLGALVASALGTSQLHTVRPTGHPFSRQLALSPALAQRLSAHQGPFAIVDEGPGLSGSSFNSVADWLVGQGVDESRLHFFPSHMGDLGSAARPEHRERWRTAQKHHVGFEQLVLDAEQAEHRLSTWIDDLVGPTDGELHDLSGGNWRSARFNPPADPMLERRKYRVSTQGGIWLAKFAGIGAAGAQRLALGQRLAESGFAPQPAGLVHGFLLLPWIEDQRVGGETVPLSRIADYLAFRAGLEAPQPGASLDQLFAMARFNLGQYLGPASQPRLNQLLVNPERFTPRPCCTDNRLHQWEWVKSAGGWLKLDSLDHHAAHDLVGPQDIAWDIAGAVVEFALDSDGQNELVEALEARTGHAVEAGFLELMILCYLGFQIGLWTMARDRASAEDRGQIEALLARYGRHRSLRSFH